MNISSLLQSMNTYGTTAASGTGTQSTQNSQNIAEILKKLSEQQDSVSFSAEGMSRSQMPPPPQKVDFSEMSDEDLVSLLQTMQEKTGSIPGVEEGTDVSELTSEQLQGIRDTLSEMSSKMEEMRGMRGMHGMGGMQGMRGMQGPPPMDVQSMSDDSLKSLLEKIQEDTGSIPGIENSESTEVSSLSEEQLQTARDALTEMMQKRIEEMMQSQVMSRAISSYEANSVLL